LKLHAGVQQVRRARSDLVPTTEFVSLARHDPVRFEGFFSARLLAGTPNEWAASYWKYRQNAKQVMAQDSANLANIFNAVVTQKNKRGFECVTVPCCTSMGALRATCNHFFRTGQTNWIAPASKA
jgi:hypothetical protein